MASALDFDLAHKRQVLIAGVPGAADTRALLRLVNERFLPNKILLLADDSSGQQQLARWLPFVADVHRIPGEGHGLHLRQLCLQIAHHRSRCRRAPFGFQPVMRLT